MGVGIMSRVSNLSCGQIAQRTESRVVMFLMCSNSTQKNRCRIAHAQTSTAILQLVSVKIPYDIITETHDFAIKYVFSDRNTPLSKSRH